MNLHPRRRRPAHLTPVPPVGHAEEPQLDLGELLTPESGASDAAAVTTPFEDWCEAHGVHPEALGAWETFAFQRARGA